MTKSGISNSTNQYASAHPVVLEPELPLLLLLQQVQHLQPGLQQQQLVHPTWAAG